MENYISLKAKMDGKGTVVRYRDLVVTTELKTGPRWRVFCCGCAAGIDPGWAQHPHAVADLWNRRQPGTNNTEKKEA